MDVTLIRMARNEMAGRVKMFDHYTNLTDLACKTGNQGIIDAVQNTIDWSTYMQEENDKRDTQIVHNVLQLQLQCSSWLLGLKERLKGLRATFDSHVAGYSDQVMELQVTMLGWLH